MLTQFSPPPSQTWPDNGRFASRPRGGNGNSAALSSIDGKPQNRKAEHRCLLCMRGHSYVPRVSPSVREKGTKKAANMGRRCFLLKHMFQQSNSCCCLSQHALSRRPPLFFCSHVHMINCSYFPTLFSVFTNSNEQLQEEKLKERKFASGYLYEKAYQCRISARN